MLKLAPTISRQGDHLRIEVHREGGEPLGTLYFKPETIFANCFGEAASFENFNQAMSWLELKANP